MTINQPAWRQAAAAWRTVRRGAAALRAIHNEQVLRWELFWQSSRVPGGPGRAAGLGGQPGRAPVDRQPPAHPRRRHRRPAGTKGPSMTPRPTPGPAVTRALHCVDATLASCRGGAATEVVNRCLT
jgi:hypothetical protein